MRARLLTCVAGRSSGPVFASSASEVQSKQTNGAASPGSAPCSSGEYNKQLTALNCSVRDWITKHVNDNPLCDLNPIFRDYERHLATIERQFGAPPAALSSGATLFPSSKAAPEVKPPPGVTFNFGQKVDGPALVASHPSPSAFSFTSSSRSSLLGGAAVLSSPEAPPTTGRGRGGGLGTNRK